MKTHERNDAALRIPDQTRTRTIDKSGSFLSNRRVTSLMAVAGVSSLLLGLETLPTTAQDMIQQDDDLEPTPTPQGDWGQMPNASLTEPQPTLVAMAQTEATLITPTPTPDRPTPTPSATHGSENATLTPTETPTLTPYFVTPTPSNTATFEAVTPTVTPTAYQTEVATASLDSTRFVDVNQLARYPRTIRYTNWLYEQDVSLRVNFDQLSRLMTVNGTPLPFGVYDEAHPLPIDPNVFEGFQEYRGGDLRPVYIVGILTEIEGWQDRNPNPTTSYANPEFTVTIPLPDGTYFPVIIRMGTVGGRYVAIDSEGSMVGLPTQILDDYNRIPYQHEGTDYITYSRPEKWLTFPTSQGTSILRVGDPIIVRVVFNLDVYNPSYRNGFIVSSSGRLPEEVVADLYDNNPGNNGVWYQESSAVAAPFQPINTTVDGG